MGLLSSKDTNSDDSTEDFHYPSSKSALIIFTRNPELGKVKTRLAVTIGDEAALRVYKFLLQHTVDITKNLKTDKYVFYSEKKHTGDLWDEEIFRKKLQHGNDLGERMKNAFQELFEAGYEKLIIVGSDIFELQQKDIEAAFEGLNDHDYTLGPAKDGGYYLLGMKQLNEKLFQNKNWGHDSVLKDTEEDLKNEVVFQLEEKNDIDYYSDIRDVDALQHLLPDHLDNTF